MSGIRRWVALAGALAALATVAASQAVAGASVPVTSSGGMVKVSSQRLSGSTLARVTPTASTASTVSCRHHTFVGNAGYIAVQTSKRGYVAWGIYMYAPQNKWGHWEVNVYVGSRRVDHKSQNYEPHGSVSPRDAKKGRTFHITATMTNENGTFVNVPNACIIP